MSLGQHLVELRKRITWSFAAIVVFSVPAWWAVDYVWAALSAPVLAVAESQDRDATLAYTTIGEAFDTRLLIMLLIGIVASSPIWLYQLWAFIVPALHQREKRFAVGFIAASVPLFVGGCLAAWFVFPNIVILLTSFAFGESATLLSARIYLDFAIKFILAIGIGFLFPVVLVALNLARVITGAGILKAWRWAIVGIAAFTAIATPAADVLSMVLLAIPMIGLFYAAAGIASINDKRIAKREAAMNAEYGIRVDD
jgi:sec-independent protein translocase protein TatC